MPLTNWGFLKELYIERLNSMIYKESCDYPSRSLFDLEGITLSNSWTYKYLQGFQNLAG